jgi:hypothetical protein
MTTQYQPGDAMRAFKAAFENCIVGIAVPHLVEVADAQVLPDVDYVYGTFDRKRYIVSERVIWSKGKSRKKKRTKDSPRMLDKAAVDLMIEPVGKPGSEERVLALIEQYDRLGKEERSPFHWGEDDAN